MKIETVEMPKPGERNVAAVDDRIEPPRVLRTRWQQAVLVCRQCQKRGSGPTKLKAKSLMRCIGSELESASIDRRSRPRVVPTQCLGLCPKRAIATAVPDRQGRLVIFAISDGSQVPVALQAAAQAPA